MIESRFHIVREGWKDRVSVYFRRKLGPDGPMANASPVQMWVNKPEDEGKFQSPMMEMDGAEAEIAMQSLMDELWREGYRPKDIGTAGHLAATQAHLADFRALVSKTLDVKLP